MFESGNRSLRGSSTVFFGFAHLGWLASSKTLGMPSQEAKTETNKPQNRGYAWPIAKAKLGTSTLHVLPATFVLSVPLRGAHSLL